MKLQKLKLLRHILNDRVYPVVKPLIVKVIITGYAIRASQQTLGGLVTMKAFTIAHQEAAKAVANDNFRSV